MTDHTPNPQRRPWREELAARVKPEALRAYLERTGWGRNDVDYRVTGLTMYMRGQSKCVVSEGECSYALGALERIENRNPADIVADILGDPTAETLLRNLLAVIHRDGGQHCETHGIAKATADATLVVNELRGSGESRMPCGHPASAAGTDDDEPTQAWVDTESTPPPADKRFRFAREIHPQDEATDGWVVELEPGVWIAPGAGDPGRTLKLDNAKVFADVGQAESALEAARKCRPFRCAAVHTRVGGGEPLPAGTGDDYETGSPAAPAVRADSPGAAPATPSPGLVEALREVLKAANPINDYSAAPRYAYETWNAATGAAERALAAYDAGTLPLAADGTLPVPEGTMIEVTLRGEYRLAEARSKLRRGILYNHFDEDDIQLGELSGLHPVVRLAAPQPETKPEGGAS